MFDVSNDDKVTMNGVTKRWEDLTPAGTRPASR